MTPTRLLAPIALGLLGAAVPGVTADATGAPAPGTVCASRAEIVEKLEGEYREVKTGSGMVDAHFVVELFVSRSGSWTLLATGTDGRSCVVAVGEGWDNQILASLPQA